MWTILIVFGIAVCVAGHDPQNHQSPLPGPHQSLWYNTLPGDGGKQADSVRLLTQGRLIVQGLVLGLLTAETYQLHREALNNIFEIHNPDYRLMLNTRYDNTWALKQIEEGHYSILSRAPKTDANQPGPAKKGKTLPRVITLGGDHTITLPLLRSINRAYGPVSVIHFDSHLDTWRPKVFGGSPSEVASVNHGTYFYHAAREGLLANDTNIHAGIRTTLSGPSDYEHDGYCGFEIIEAREIDTIGTDGIIKRIVSRVGTEKPVYLSLDIDTLDPAFAPATGTPETGGWSTRELRTILRGLEDVNLIAADIVEVAPAYDTNAEHTTMAAADALYEIMSIMLKKGPLSKMIASEGGGDEL
ncbi:hypothetical protein CHU98_g6493 [Xylaria longipes]|nr:hypothetical protein CHU98_g6493 [Xylaria longipes]